MLKAVSYQLIQSTQRLVRELSIVREKSFAFRSEKTASYVLSRRETRQSKIARCLSTQGVIGEPIEGSGDDASA